MLLSLAFLRLKRRRRFEGGALFTRTQEMLSVWLSMRDMEAQRQVDEDEAHEALGMAIGPKGRRALKQARTRIRTTELEMDDEDDAAATQPQLDPSVWKPRADEVPAWVAPSSLTNGAKGATEAPKDPQDMSIGELKMRLTSLGVDPAGYIEKGEMVSALQAKLAEIE